MGCCIATPVPPPDQEYVGDWTLTPSYSTGNMRITASGHIDFRENQGSMSTQLTGPICEFTRDKFVFKVLCITKTFNVEDPPQLSSDGRKYRMVVNQREWTRSK
eukprot:TRINITY_DN1856_c0_g1_i1.p1 TRINITY_DN1856_c0_g1~~TRINITY_DN1856_c0_g1_i1.p1  ORF type:complete len:104 (-),score=7.17 TRINITY_DN1856_c0_g1_i1:17-328(-)